MKVVKVKSLLSFPVPAFMKVYVLKGMRGREKNHYDGRERVELLGLFFLGGVLCWVFMASEQQEWFVVLSFDACTCWVEKKPWKSYSGFAWSLLEMLDIDTCGGVC